jgi:5'-3' exonuclease
MTDLIVDGNSLYAKAWYATSKDFIDANASLRSALQTTFSLLNRDVDRVGSRIDRTLFCWDGQHGRDKGDRTEKPKAYFETRITFQDLLTSLIGTNHATAPNNEADDTVASAAEQSQADDIYIVSGDKDLMQLQSDRVHYFCLNAKAVLSRPCILTKFGVKHPRQIAIAQAVLGDRIDNIPGIKGWGPAKVKTLFRVITEKMTFQQALDAIERQIPDEHLEAFYSSLERTLLDVGLSGLPEPAPLKLATVEEMMDCGVTGLEDSYIRMYTSYTGRTAHRQPLKVGMEEDD